MRKFAPPHQNRLNKVLFAILLTASFPSYSQVQYDGIINGPIFYQNKDNYDYEGHYLIKPENGVIEGDCKPDENPQHYDTPLTVSYSKLFAYIDENVTIKDDAATIFLESNVEHDAKLSLNGLNANTSLTLMSFVYHWEDLPK